MNFPVRVSAVTIDLDGTLLDTIPDLAAAANMMLKTLGCGSLEVERIRTFVGKGIPRLVERTLDEARIRDTPRRERALALFERFYTETNGRHTTIYPGVREGLEKLRAQALPLACLTNKAGEFTQPLLEAQQLDSYFEHVIAGDTLPYKKPHPAPLLHACEYFGVEPRSMLMIGDSVNDAQAARAAGCPIFCVTYGYNEGHDVRALGADAVLDSLLDAVALIEKA